MGFKFMKGPARLSVPRLRVPLGFALAVLFVQALPVAAQTDNEPEITTQESAPTFKFEVERNMVLVRVVVRDSNGRPVAGLRKEDFRLFDQGKPQVISQFAVETPSAPPQKETKPAVPPPSEEEAAEETPPSVLHNYLALFFDDVQMSFDDVTRIRKAAEHYLETGLRPEDRVGIFTTSGQTVVDFTGDRDVLRQALTRLRSRPAIDTSHVGCEAEVDDYQAYLMVHERNPYALSIAAQEQYHCYCENLPPAAQASCSSMVQSQVDSMAIQVLNRYEMLWDSELRGLNQLVRRMAMLPGRRSIIFISPGFLDNTIRMRVSYLVDRALRDNVTINGLDPRGLYTVIPYGDASKSPVVIPNRPDLIGKKQQFIIEGIARHADVMRTFAQDTGGLFFHNSNDLDEGFHQIGSLETVYYVLAFSPQNLKLDGRFHNLKVELVNRSGETIQARRGYFAPKKSDDPTKRVKEEIQQVLFSHEEMHELPVEVHTQFFKISNSDAKLSVLTRLDVHLLTFHKEGDRNLKQVTFVTGLFDRDGKFISGHEKQLDLRLRDTSLDQVLKTGLTSKTSFDISPGVYLVRAVVRDADSGRISGLNRTVDIPY